MLSLEYWYSATLNTIELLRHTEHGMHACVIHLFAQILMSVSSVSAFLFMRLRLCLSRCLSLSRCSHM